MARTIMSLIDAFEKEHGYSPSTCGDLGTGILFSNKNGYSNSKGSSSFKCSLAVRHLGRHKYDLKRSPKARASRGGISWDGPVGEIVYPVKGQNRRSLEQKSPWWSSLRSSVTQANEGPRVRISAKTCRKRSRPIRNNCVYERCEAGAYICDQPECEYHTPGIAPERFLQVAHRDPLKNRDEIIGSLTTLDDLMLLCPNHHWLHDNGVMLVA